MRPCPALMHTCRLSMGNEKVFRRAALNPSSESMMPTICVNMHPYFLHFSMSSHLDNNKGILPPNFSVRIQP